MPPSSASLIVLVLVVVLVLDLCLLHVSGISRSVLSQSKGLSAPVLRFPNRSRPRRRSRPRPLSFARERHQPVGSIGLRFFRCQNRSYPAIKKRGRERRRGRISERGSRYFIRANVCSSSSRSLGLPSFARVVSIQFLSKEFLVGRSLSRKTPNTPGKGWSASR